MSSPEPSKHRKESLANSEKEVEDSQAHSSGANNSLEFNDDEMNSREFLIFPVPKRLRYRPDKPFRFSYSLNIACAIATAIMIGNLYYCQPLLISMAETFDVSYERVSRIPTLVQIGYAVGMLVICPLGDILRRRQLILFMTFLTLAFSVGLAITRNVHVFEALTFLVGFTNIANQIFVPMVAEIAPLERRAFTYSIMLAGLQFGILFARVLAGIIGQFVQWRIVYYTAVGLQVAVLVGLYFILPDFPTPNKGLAYWKIHWTMGKLALTEPVVLQALIINIGTSACFSYFWVTLTFLLGGPPYHYSTLAIGLFGLIGMAGVAAGPLGGRIVDGVHRWYAILIATVILAMFQIVHAVAGGLHISAVVIACFGLDFFQQVQGIAIVMSILSVSSTAISRLNALYILTYYLGQLIGTSVGSLIFVSHGWRAAGGFGLALYGLQLSALALRGPHCKQYTWFGYEGGLSFRRKTGPTDDIQPSESLSSDKQ